MGYIYFFFTPLGFTSCSTTAVQSFYMHKGLITASLHPLPLPSFCCLIIWPHVARAPPLGAGGLAQNGRPRALPLPGKELWNCFVMSPPHQHIYPSPYRLSHWSTDRPIHQSLKCQGLLENTAAPVVNKEGDTAGSQRRMEEEREGVGQREGKRMKKENTNRETEAGNEAREREGWGGNKEERWTWGEAMLEEGKGQMCYIFATLF